MRTFLDYPIKRRLFEVEKFSGKLYYRGNFNEEIFKRSIAIVGTRMMTNYGKQVVDEFVSEFAAKGITTISGFMYGVDSEVHKKTIEYGGKTIAIFGNGLDWVYPSENENLYLQILESGGMVLSEYKKNMKPKLWTYPARNKIVAGLATIGILVIEAGLDSGSLITAKIARQLKKNVWAVPGQINLKSSQGTNFLIQNGFAKMTTSPSDILGKSIKVSQVSKENLNDFEAEVYAILERENLSIDEISIKLNKDVVDVTSCLTMMGLRGMVGELGGKYYLNKKL